MGSFYKELCASMSVFSQATGVNVCILDENGEEKDHFGSTCRYCELIQQDGELAQKCKENHRDAAKQAAELQDCYFYVCHANMVHFSIALMDPKFHAGSILAGPLLLDYPDAAALDAVIEQCNIPPGCRSIFFAAMKDVVLLEPRRIYYLGELLFRLIFNQFSRNSTQTIQMHKSIKKQLNLVDESMPKVTKPDRVRALQEKQETELTELIETGDIEQIQVLLNDILGNIYFSSGNDIELIKMRMNELIAVISRRIIYLGSSADEVYDIVNDFQKSSARMSDVIEISYKLGQVLRKFVEMMDQSIPPHASEAVKQSLNYIHKNYRKQITLEEVADIVALSPTHFSKLFKGDMGIGFSAYINQLRLQKAKKLLEESELSLAEITQNVGYSNQQYFSRVFKEYNHMTPGQYRRRHRSNQKKQQKKIMIAK
jgi:AraC-like DNA-binding protein/ligand-binding sensor protein